MAVAMINDISYETLADAIMAANNSEDGATIVLTSDIEFDAALTISKNIVLEGNYTITRALSYSGTFLTVNNGATLTIKDVTIDGNNNWTFDKVSYDEALYSKTVISNASVFITSQENAPIANKDIFIVKGSMILNNTTIRNHMGISGSNVFDLTGTIILNNGTIITHNAAPSDSTIVAMNGGSTFIINDGAEINDTYAGRNGGISRCNNSTIIMNGGIITGTNSVNTSGTVFMMYGTGAYFEMNGGEISNNTGVAGSSNSRNAAIYLHSNGQMVMNGGVITGNVGITAGGITYRNDSSVLTINNGYVGNNTAVEEGYDDDIQANSNAQISGGTFTQDVSQWCADGYAIIQLPDGTWNVKTTLFQIYTCINGIMHKCDMYVCINGTIKKIDQMQSNLIIK